MTRIWVILAFGLAIITIGFVVGKCLGQDEVEQDTGKNMGDEIDEAEYKYGDR